MSTTIGNNFNVGGPSSASNTSSAGGSQDPVQAALQQLMQAIKSQSQDSNSGDSSDSDSSDQIGKALHQLKHALKAEQGQGQDGTQGSQGGQQLPPEIQALLQQMQTQGQDDSSSTMDQ